MASTYTTNLGIEKIGTGEQSGTWGDTTNTNFDILDEAINGIISITLSSAGSSGSPNSLPITDGASSNGRNKFIEFVDGGDLGGTAYVQLTPNDAEKIVHIRNSLSSSRSIIVFQGTYNASNDFEIVNGADVLLKFNGGGSGATVTDVNVDLTVTGLTAASAVLTTADINGGTADNVTIGGSTAAVGTFTTANATTVDTTNIEVTNIKAKDGTSAGSIADSTGVVTLASSVLTTTDINGGTADNVTIGGSTAAAGTFTTFTSTGIDDNATSTAITIDSSERVGIGTTSPDFNLEVEGSSNQVISIQTTGTTDNTQIRFGDADNSDQGKVNYDHSTDAMTFHTSDAERVRIDSSGNVGIGTSNPDAPLHVKVTESSTGETDPLVRFERFTSGDNAYLDITVDNANNLIGFQSTGSSDGGFTFGGASTERMRIDGSGNVGIGSAGNAKLQVFGPSASSSLGTYSNSAAIVSNNAGGYGISFSVDGSGTGYIQAQNFTSSAAYNLSLNSAGGNVGIGTATVNRKLELAGNNNGGAKANYLRITDTDTTATAANQQGGIEFYASDSSAGAGVTASIEVVYAGSGGGGEITFNTAANSGAGVSEAMRVDESGNVGIGATSLTNKLTVNGNQVMLASGEMKFADAGNSLVSTIKNGGSSGTSQMQFLIGSTPAEVMRLDTSGRLLLGCTTSNGSFISSNHTQINVQGQASGAIGSLMLRSQGTTNATAFELAASDGVAASYLWNGSASAMVFATSNTERMRLDSSGNLLVGTTDNPASSGSGSGFIDTSFGRNQLRFVHTDNTGASRSFLVFYGGTAGNTVGSITASNSATTYNTTSDQRLKENIVDAPAGNIDAIRIRSFDWKADGSHQTYGMVAQELVDVAPEAVSQGETEDDMWGVDYSKLVPMMIKEIQDLRARVAQLEGA